MTHNPTRPAGTGRGNRACLPELKSSRRDLPTELLLRLPPLRSQTLWFFCFFFNYYYYQKLRVLSCSCRGVHVFSPRTCCVYNYIHNLSLGSHCAALVGCAVSCAPELCVHHRHRHLTNHRYLIESALVTPGTWSHDRPPAGPTAHMLTVPGMMGADLPLSGSRTSRFINGGGE